MNNRPLHLNSITFLVPLEKTSLVSHTKAIRCLVAIVPLEACLLWIMKEKLQSVLESGPRFTMTTHNKNTHPLPNWDLLVLQWSLQRIGALRGTAELFDHYGDDADDADVPDGGIVEPHTLPDPLELASYF